MKRWSQPRIRLALGARRRPTPRRLPWTAKEEDAGNRKKGIVDHLKIAINAPPWEPVPPPAYGGIEAVVHALAVELKAAGHDVLLYTVGASTCPVRRAWGLDTGQVHMGQAVTELHHVMLAYEAVPSFDIVHDHPLMGPVYAER